MKTLVVNNHTQHLNELVSVFPNVTVIDRKELQSIDNLGIYDLLVFSGGSSVPTILRHPEEYKAEIETVKKTTIPVIGICLGCEVITKAFGGELQELPEEHRGVIDLQITNSDLEKSLGSSKITVMEGHHIGIKQMPQSFVSCAQSEHGVEIIKHKDRPIIGVQFHPEISNNQKIVQWLLNEVTNSSEPQHSEITQKS